MGANYFQEVGRIIFYMPSTSGNMGATIFRNVAKNTYPSSAKSIGGWGAELNREIVSCRVCVRAVCMPSEFGVKIYGL